MDMLSRNKLIVLESLLANPNSLEFIMQTRVGKIIGVSQTDKILQDFIRNQFIISTDTNMGTKIYNISDNGQRELNNLRSELVNEALLIKQIQSQIDTNDSIKCSNRIQVALTLVIAVATVAYSIIAYMQFKATL